jgi:SAM-dependent methyltransferase
MKKKLKNLSEKSMHYELYITKKQVKFNDWLYSKMKPYLKGDILETGSGIGTFSEKIIRDFLGKVYLTEIDPFFLKELEKKFKSPRVTIAKLDLNNKEDFSKIKFKFDSIFSSNVLEHIKDDVLALKLIKNILKPRGVLVLLVPCHKFLFCDLDITEGHYRRYSKKELEEKAKKAGFKIKKAFWFNTFAIPGRFVNGNIFKSKKTHASSFGLFNKIILILRFFEEKIFKNIIGVSRIVVLEK